MTAQHSIVPEMTSITPKPSYADVEDNYRHLLTYMKFAEEQHIKMHESMTAVFLLATGFKYILEKNKADNLNIPNKHLETLLENVSKQKVILANEFTPAYLIDALPSINESENKRKLNDNTHAYRILEDYPLLTRHMFAVYELIGAIEDTLTFETETVERFAANGQITPNNESVLVPAKDVMTLYHTAEQHKSLSDLLQTLLTKRELAYTSRPVNIYDILEKANGIIEFKVKKEGHHLIRRYEDKPRNIHFRGDETRAITIPLIIVNNALKAFNKAGIKDGRICMDYDPFDSQILKVTFGNNGPPIKSDPFYVPEDIVNTPWRKVRGGGLSTCLDIVEDRFGGVFAYENLPTGVMFEMQVQRETDLKLRKSEPT